jgi:hypothetical protein
VQLAHRGGLLEREHALAEQLQQREEARHRGERVRRVTGQRTERARTAAPQAVHDHRGLLAHADRRGVHVRQRHHRLRPRRQGPRGQLGQALRRQGDQHLG